MKKFSILVIFGICFMISLLSTTGAFGQDDIPTVTLPISNLLEVRKDLIRKEGNAFPGGWSESHSSLVIPAIQNQAHP